MAAICRGESIAEETYALPYLRVHVKAHVVEAAAWSRPMSEMIDHLVSWDHNSFHWRAATE